LESALSLTRSETAALVAYRTKHGKFNATAGKNFERSGSFGPWLMTPDEFNDPIPL
jgi:2-keto-4-pentenoate hydratase/2-oxohepta-3-ene-1,7-dioic acid hydratase in catechol pathway